MHAWEYVKNRKSGYLSYRYLLLSRFFRAQNILASCLTSNHGVPMRNPHISILVTKSAFTYARKNTHSGGPRNKKCTSSTSTCLSVWAKNILGSSLMIAHDGIRGKQHIDTYVTEPSFTNTRAHRKRAVFSLTKARIIFTNRTKKRNPTKPKSAKSTHLDE
jgi:hypothetical protein